MKFFDRMSIWVIGLICGGVIGFFAAPAWEMAGLFVGVFGAVTGAISSQCAAFPPKGIIGSVLATLTGSGVFFLLARVFFALKAQIAMLYQVAYPLDKVVIGLLAAVG